MRSPGVLYGLLSYDWANDGSAGVSFRHVMVSGLRGELACYFREWV